MNQVEASTPVVPTNKHLTRITKEIAVTPLRRLSRQNISAVPDTVVSFQYLTTLLVIKHLFF